MTGALYERAEPLHGSAGALCGRVGALQERAGVLRGRTVVLCGRDGALYGRTGVTVQEQMFHEVL